MSELGSDPPAQTDETPAEPVETSGRNSRSVTVTVPGFPRWLKLVLLAVIPALIVGAVVYLVAHKSKASNNTLAAAVVDGFLRLGGNDPTAPIQSYVGTNPPGFPNDVPVYPGAKIIASFSLASAQGNTYFVLYSSPDPVTKIMSFYNDKLDKDPWQVEGAQNSNTSTALHFSKPADPDIDGSLSINHSDLDPTSTIYLSIQDTSADAAKSAPQPKFTPSPSLQLPNGFDAVGIPIFKSGDSVVTDTLYQKDSGSTSFLVSFLTHSQPNDVLDFYKTEFQKKGWTVTDSKPQSSTSFSQGIDFQDSGKTIQGTISADAFPGDRNYTKVDMQVQAASKSNKSSN